MYKSTHFSLIEEHSSDRDKKMIVVHRGVGVNDPDLEATFTDPVHLTLSPAHMRNWSAWITRDMQEYPLPLECPFQTIQSLKTLLHCRERTTKSTKCQPMRIKSMTAAALPPWRTWRKEENHPQYSTLLQKSWRKWRKMCATFLKLLPI